MFAMIAIVALSFAVSARADEFRGIWVDSWHSGFENPQAVQNLIAYAKACNTNAIVIEVRKRADAYYISSIEPVGINVTPQSGYDCLAETIVKAHAQNIKVYAWVVAYRVWNSASGPSHSTPEHLWFTHPQWQMRDENGSTLTSEGATSLDPGVPAVEEYLSGVFTDIVKRYDVDGFVLDYIRYPGKTWGYNPVSISRFNREYRRSGKPVSTDSLWQAWRREQITNLVKRSYLEIKAIKPTVRVGAATWRTAQSGNSIYLQNWDQWMASHILDFASPMNYTPNNAAFRLNNQDNLTRAYGRHIYPSPGCYLNPVAGSISQIKDIQDLGFPGSCLYSYAATNAQSPNPAALKNALIADPFATIAAIPDMAWLSSPTTGYLKGFVRDSSGAAIYPAVISIVHLGISSKNSGTGFYGFTDLPIGSITATASAPGMTPQTVAITIKAGKVTTHNFILGLAPFR